MQYPSGTSFQVNKRKLGSSGLPYKFLFNDGSYTIANIRKNLDKTVYTFIYNTQRVSLSCNACFEFDKIIAFCRDEIFKEPIYSEIDVSL